jgi:phage virion morphogenesis protein
MMRLSISINDGEVKRKLAKLAEDIGNFKTPLRRSGIYMERKTDQRFRSGGFGKWEKLKPSTIRRRRKGSSSILQDTGRLKQSVTSSPDIYHLTKTYLRIGTTVKYAKYHQNGTRHMPARPFLLIDEEDERKIKEIFSRWVEELVAKL